MERFEVRPRFELQLAVHPDVLAAALEDAVAGDDRSWARLPYAEFGVPEDERHLWSPRLAVCVHEGDDAELRLVCRFQPEPSVWTLYMAIGFVLLVGGCIATAWTLSSWLLGWSVLLPGAALGASLLLGGLLYAVAGLGQRMASDQMADLAERLWLALCDASARAAGREPLTVSTRALSLAQGRVDSMP
ncbi:MAG: hypothetical protein ACE37F_11220 [Nannocystaceae bacterium]|nr:hypothetical protein [bacterium]